jgi:hypothetical protein
MMLMILTSGIYSLKDHGPVLIPYVWSEENRAVWLKRMADLQKGGNREEPCKTMRNCLKI